MVNRGTGLTILRCIPGVKSPKSTFTLVRLVLSSHSLLLWRLVVLVIPCVSSGLLS